MRPNLLEAGGELAICVGVYKKWEATESCIIQNATEIWYNIQNAIDISMWCSLENIEKYSPMGNL